MRIAQDTPEGRTPLFVDAEVWEEAAVRVAAHLVKGDPVAGTGVWDRSEWVDRETGKTRSKTFIRVRGIGPDLSRCDIAKMARRQPKAAVEEGDGAQQGSSPDSVPADPMDED